MIRMDYFVITTVIGILDLGEWEFGLDDETPKTSLHSLPEKSKANYETAYNKFTEWRKLKAIEEVTQEVLLEYFAEQSINLKSPSLWSKYSMLKATMIVNDNIDISKYSELLAFLKSKGIGYLAQRSKTFTREEINHFFMEAPDDTYLMMKVAMIFAIAGGCTRDELTRVTVDDIEDMGTILIVKVMDPRTKSKRTFIVNSDTHLGYNLTDIYRKYANLRPHNTDHKRFFLFYKDGKCSKQVVGVNSFGKMPSQIATFLDLPEPTAYTGHSFRRSRASLLN